MLNTKKQSSYKTKVLEYKCRVNSNIKINNDYRLLNIKFPLKNIKILPGQFFHLLCPSYDDVTPYLRRPMSIYNFNYNKNEIEFLFKIHGEGTYTLSNLKKNEFLNVLGPLGNNFIIKINIRTILLSYVLWSTPLLMQTLLRWQGLEMLI